MPDLINDGTGREAALARMIAAFPTNRGLWPMYRLMAGAHRFAIDYIEQAPVIVLAAAHGNAHVSWSERAFIQEQLRKMCESKAQLRDVMWSYGLPRPLRLLDARVPGDGHQAAGDAARTHLSDAPLPRAVHEVGRIVATPFLARTSSSVCASLISDRQSRFDIALCFAGRRHMAEARRHGDGARELAR